MSHELESSCVHAEEHVKSNLIISSSVVEIESLFFPSYFNLPIDRPASGMPFWTICASCKVTSARVLPIGLVDFDDDCGG
jgi:hypothetical protein